MDDAEAIARLKQNHIDGLEALVQRHQVQAIRAAYLVTRDRTLAEDIVQSAFIRVYERIDQFDETRPFSPWFLRSVINDAVKAARRRERHVSLESTTQTVSLAELIPDPQPGPARQAETAEIRQAVWNTLGELSPKQRAAVVLRYYLGLSEAELARELSCAPGTVKSHLFQAKRRLRTLMRPLWLTFTGRESDR
jgi:RNA polymerase sigma-70 factor, ECF subfamily